MPVDGSEDQVPSSLSSPASAALTPGGTEEDGATGGSAVCSQGSEAAAAYPTNTGPGEGNSGEQLTLWISLLSSYSKHKG